MNRGEPAKCHPNPLEDKITKMYRHDHEHLEFISLFVDSVTVRPFLEDLRRVKQAAALFQRLPRAQRLDESTEAA